jgi:hypothetical protein
MKIQSYTVLVIYFFSLINLISCGHQIPPTYGNLVNAPLKIVPKKRQNNLDNKTQTASVASRTNQAPSHPHIDNPSLNLQMANPSPSSNVGKNPQNNAEGLVDPMLVSLPFYCDWTFYPPNISQNVGACEPYKGRPLTNFGPGFFNFEQGDGFAGHGYGYYGPGYDGGFFPPGHIEHSKRRFINGHPGRFTDRDDDHGDDDDHHRRRHHDGFR